MRKNILTTFRVKFPTCKILKNIFGAGPDRVEMTKNNFFPLVRARPFDLGLASVG